MDVYFVYHYFTPYKNYIYIVFFMRKMSKGRGKIIKIAIYFCMNQGEFVPKGL